MPKLLEGKTALVLGVWNKWSIAFAISQAFAREGAKLLLTYQNERAKPTVEDLGKELGAAGFYPCDVQQQPDIDGLAASLKAEGQKLDVVVHCLAGANHEDLNQPFVNTSRDGFNLALDVSESPVQKYPRVHLDLYAGDAVDQAAEIDRLVVLGATRVEWDRYPENPDFVVLADPEGNLFCVIDTGLS